MTTTVQPSDPTKIDQEHDESGVLPSDPTGSVRPVHQMSQMTRVDRIDDRGDIREHLTRDGRRTICGIEIGQRQAPCGNRPCKHCEKIAKRCQIAPTTASGQQMR
jgi:hypothetical protein